MPKLAVLLLLALFLSAMTATAQTWTNPVNAPNSADPVGIPPNVSADGTNELVNLSTGTLSAFIPVASFPQRNGTNLSLGYTHSSATYAFREYVVGSLSIVGTAGGIAQDNNYYQDYFQQVVPPLVPNLPTLSASITFMGVDFTNCNPLNPLDSSIACDTAHLNTHPGQPIWAVTNFVFTDWAGNSHSFPTHSGYLGILEYNEPVDLIYADPVYQGQYIPSFGIPGQQTQSGEGLFYRLDTGNHNDVTVTDQHGTVYHFTTYASPFRTPNNTWYPTPAATASRSVEQYYFDVPTSIVDTNGNTMSLTSSASGTAPGGPFKIAAATIQITDTVGRSIHITPNGMTWMDSNGTSQTALLTLSSGPGTTPGFTPHIALSSCQVNYIANHQFHQAQADIYDSTPLAAVPLPSATLTLPAVNGVSRTFNMVFDAMGRLLKITYPSGGSTSYSFSANSNLVSRATYASTCTVPLDEVQSKIECTSADGSCSSPLKTTYTPTVLNHNYPQNYNLLYNNTMTVQDPFGNSTKYAYGPMGNAAVAGVFPVETDAFYSSVAGTLLRTVHTDYMSNLAYVEYMPQAAFPADVITTLNDGSSPISSKVVYNYDTVTAISLPISNPSQVDEYDFGASSPTRTTKYTYETGGIFDFTTNNILDRVATKAIIDVATGNQNTTTFGYDSVGNVSSKSVSGTGFTTENTSYLRDSYGNVTKITDPLNYQTTVGYGNPSISGCPTTANIGLPTSVTDPLNHTSLRAYYSNTGLLACTQDPNGLVSKYQYDALNRMIEQDLPDGGQTKVTFKDSPAFSTTTSTKIDSAHTLTKTVIFDGLNRPAQSQLTSDPDGTVFADTTYDGLGRVLCSSNPYRSLNDATYGINTKVYDTLSRVVAVQPPDYWSNSGASSPTCQNLTQSTAPANPSNKVQTIYAGNKTTVTDQAGVTRSSFTDGLGRLSEVDEGLPVIYYSTPSTGSITVAQSSQCPNGACSASTLSGSVGSFAFSVSYSQSTSYGTVGGMLAVKFNNSSSSPVTATVKAGPNNSASVVLTSKVLGSSANNIPIQLNSASPNYNDSSIAMSGGMGPIAYSPATIYSYDGFNNLTEVLQHGDTAIPSQRFFQYDALSRLTSAANPESGTMSYAYDLDNNLKTKTDARGYITTYNYDHENRLTSKTYSNGDQPVAYYYDGNAPTGCITGLSTYGLAIHKRTAMCDASGVEGWQYNLIVNTGFQTVEKRTTNSIVKSYSVQNDLAGITSQFVYPSQSVLNYTVSNSGSLLSAADTAGITYISAAHYAPSGGLAAYTSGSGISTSAIYNPRLQPCWIYSTTSTALPWNSTLCTGSATTGNIIDLKYDFHLGASDNGNVMGITNDRFPTRSQTFTYDGVNRIATAQTTSTHATAPNDCWGEVYNIDGFGNLLSLTQTTNSAYAGCTSESAVSYPVTSANQISGYCYDASGNLLDPGTCPVGSNPVHTYAYNAENQLKVTAATTYLYDGDGKRVAKSFGGSVNKIYWYGPSGEVLDETDGTGSTANSAFDEYVFFGGQRLARRDYLGNVSYYFADHLGTSRIVTNSAGAILDDSDFYPYGGERIYLSSSGNRHKFTGKERDSESGLDNFGARYYASTIARFMQTDPKARSAHIGDPQSWNRYAYVTNRPLIYFDPNGLDKYLVVYVDQPHPGTADRQAGRYGTNLGHAFVGLRDTDTRKEVRVGFYPNGSSLDVAQGKTVPGTIKNNDQHMFNVEKDFKLTDKQYQALVDSIKHDAQNTPTYNLYNSNCTDWVIQKANSVGVNLPTNSGGEANPNNPADLGQALAAQGADRTFHPGAEPGSSDKTDPQKSNDMTPLNQLPSSVPPPPPPLKKENQ